MDHLKPQNTERKKWNCADSIPVRKQRTKLPFPHFYKENGAPGPNFNVCWFFAPQQAMLRAPAFNSVLTRSTQGQSQIPQVKSSVPQDSPTHFRCQSQAQVNSRNRTFCAIQFIVLTTTWSYLTYRLLIYTKHTVSSLSKQDWRYSFGLFWIIKHFLCFPNDLHCAIQLLKMLAVRWFWWGLIFLQSVRVTARGSSCELPLCFLKVRSHLWICCPVLLWWRMGKQKLNTKK